MSVDPVSIDQIFDWIRTGGIVGLLALAAKLYVDRRRLQIEAKAAVEAARTAAKSADLSIEIHRDGLTFQLLDAARTELAVLRTEVERLRPGEEHLLHFQQALDHLERLLTAEGPDLVLAKRSAKAFLNRMRRLSEARGTIMNELQRQDSQDHLSDNGRTDE